MKFPVICMLVLAGVLIAGCTTTPAPTAVTPEPTTVPATPVVQTTSSQPVFTLGSHYLEDPGGYLLLTDNDTIVKEFRVDSTSWGIYFKVLPLNDNLQYCWFEVDVTNVDMGTTERFGYGRERSLELEQWIPMYREGPYRLTMRGNNVKVWLTAAKRNP
jgi:hypothetical protein